MSYSNAYRRLENLGGQVEARRSRNSKMETKHCLWSVAFDKRQWHRRGCRGWYGVEGTGEGPRCCWQWIRFRSLPLSLSLIMHYTLCIVTKLSWLIQTCRREFGPTEIKGPQAGGLAEQVTFLCLAAKVEHQRCWPGNTNSEQCTVRNILINSNPIQRTIE